MEKLKLDNITLKKFGITMGIAFLVIALIILLKHKSFNPTISTLSAIFFILAFTFPILLKPVYIFWMQLAKGLGWINTRLILLIIFYLIFTPIGLVMRLLGVDLLARKIEKNRETYWIKKEKRNFQPQDYARQF
jgi:hypothetical protein